MIKKTLLIAAMAMAMFHVPTFANAANPTLKFCSGAKGGVYDYTAEVLTQQLQGSVDVVNVNTAGSWENLQKIASGITTIPLLGISGSSPWPLLYLAGVIGVIWRFC